MTDRFQLNLASRPFPRYRTPNVVLSGVLVALLVFSVWEGAGFLRYTEMAEGLRVIEQEARVEWEHLGDRVETVEERLNRPESVALLDEIEFLEQVIDRKGFSWIGLLAEIENVIPPSVYLMSLAPQIDASQNVLVAMEARGKSIDDLSAFIAGLEETAAFRDVKVSIEERGVVAGRPEIRVLMDVLYMPATNDRASAP